jgi:hypothetical protein
MLQDAGEKARAMATGVVAATATYMQLVDGHFRDDRWIGGRWDLNQFKDSAGEVDWDRVSCDKQRRSLNTVVDVQRLGCRSLQCLICQLNGEHIVPL